MAFELGTLQSMDQGARGELIGSGFNTLLTSDDGIFWNGHLSKRRPLCPQQGMERCTGLKDLAELDQHGLSAVKHRRRRMALSGNNGAVYTSDALTMDVDQVRNVSVREAESISVDVPRPPVNGDVTVSFWLISDTAIGGADFVQTMGQLSWADGDTQPQQVIVDTIDDLRNEPDETFRIEFGVSGPLIYSFSYEVTITDDELTFALPGNVVIVNDGVVRTSENGEGVTFGVALWSTPSQDVTVELSIDAQDEIAFEPGSLTFAPENFKRAQPVTVTGLDDGVLDGNRTVAMTFTAVSAGPEYDRLESGIAYIVNEDNEIMEASPVIFANGFETPWSRQWNLRRDRT